MNYILKIKKRKKTHYIELSATSDRPCKEVKMAIQAYVLVGYQVVDVYKKIQLDERS